MALGVYDGNSLAASSPTPSIVVGLVDGTTSGDLRVQLLNLHYEIHSLVTYLAAVLDNYKQPNNFGVTASLAGTDDDKVFFHLHQLNYAYLALQTLAASGGMRPDSVKYLRDWINTLSGGVAEAIKSGTLGGPAQEPV